MTPHPAAADQTAVEVDSLDFCYGSKQSLFNVTMKVPRNRVTAFIGPSGCGKSTLLRCINRMNDRIPEARVTGGSIRIDGVDVTSPSLDTIRLRREVGMVFQKSNPFPMSIYENVAYGLKLAGVKKRGILDEAVEESLRHAALWDEVKDRLHASANGLSGGQQQRLCIARSIAVKPRILLMDEPCSALDPIATVRVEELMHRLKDKFTIIVVTHNMQQATRVSDLTGFFMPAKPYPIIKPIFRIMNHDAHTLREFDAALSSLNTYLLQMAYKAQSALDLAVASLLQQNESSANRVIADDEELDELEMTVDREGLHLLAFFSPVASDLKVVLASLRMSSMYERIGDEAVTIAKRANRLNKRPRIREAALADPVYREMAERFRAVNKAVSSWDGEALAELVPALEDLAEHAASLTEAFACLRIWFL